MSTPNSRKRRPPAATQHATAGPYSPVLEVDAHHLVVISGQVAVDMKGEIIGDTIEDQAEATLRNCERLLVSAGCTLLDVFKVNIYLKDLDHWTRFNTVYGKIFVEPLPVRTAIQAVCCPGFLLRSRCGPSKRRIDQLGIG